jgi:hypothetical protein
MPKQAASAAASESAAADTEAKFVKLSDALKDSDYKKCLKLCDNSMLLFIIEFLRPSSVEV